MLQLYFISMALSFGTSVGMHMTNDNSDMYWILVTIFWAIMINSERT